MIDVHKVPNLNWSDFFIKATFVVEEAKEPSTRAELWRSFDTYKRTLYKYSKAKTITQVRRAEQKLFWSSRCRIAATVRGYSKYEHATSMKNIRLIETQVNPRKESGESVGKMVIPKSNGGVRVVNNFGPIERAKQQMVADMITARFGVSPYDFSVKGKGVNKAIARVKHLLTKGGMKAHGVIDIKNFFPSIKMEMIHSVLQLPKSIINNTILDKPDKNPAYLDYAKDAQSDFAVALGVPQGSICSSIVAGKILEKILSKINEESLTVYVDDIHVAGKDCKEIYAIYKAIDIVLKDTFPGAPLVLKKSKPVKLGSRMSFLGVWFRLKNNFGKGKFHLSPSESSLRKFYLSTSFKLLDYDPKYWGDRLRKIILDWSSGKTWWPNRELGGGLLWIYFSEDMFAKLESLYKQLHENTSCGLNDPYYNYFALKEIEKMVPKCVLKIAETFTNSKPIKSDFLFFSKNLDELALSKIKDESTSFQLPKAA